MVIWNAKQRQIKCDKCNKYSNIIKTLNIIFYKNKKENYLQIKNKLDIKIKKLNNICNHLYYHNIFLPLVILA